MPTVLVIGATGNIGTSAIIAAQKNKYSVIAVVRNQASAEKLFKNLPSKVGVTTVEADILSATGIKSVVEKVKKGELPAFQHVYAAAGGLFDTTSLVDLSLDELRKYEQMNFEPNLFAYQATIPYLLEQKDPSSSWTICVGASGDNGSRAGASMSQGALYSMGNVACNELKDTNIRYNEVYLGLFVIADAETAKQWGALTSEQFAASYEFILTKPELNAGRVIVAAPEDLTTLKFAKKHA